MIASKIGLTALLGAAVVCTAVVLRAQGAAPAQSVPARATDGASFTASGAVVRPRDYREWVYLTSGLGMSYAPEAQAAAAAATAAGQARPPVFDNVFVNRQSYRAFLESGRWPEGTMFILELRRGERHISIDTGGQTQGTMLTRLYVVSPEAVEAIGGTLFTAATMVHKGAWLGAWSGVVNLLGAVGLTGLLSTGTWSWVRRLRLRRRRRSVAVGKGSETLLPEGTRA